MLHSGAWISAGRQSLRERPVRRMQTATFIATCGLVAGLALPALADPIEGNWKTEAGTTAEIAPCGGAYCITLKSGDHSGKNIGRLEGSDGSYQGSITDPENDKTYKGKASVKGGALKLSGCVLGGLICRSQNWRKL